MQHFVYSGLVSANLLSNGAVPSACFDGGFLNPASPHVAAALPKAMTGKYEVGEYAKTKGFKSVVIVCAGWYMESNLAREIAAEMGGFPFDVDDEGYLTFRVPRWGGANEIPFISMEDDWGDLVHGVLLDPERYDGHFIHGISDWAQPEKMVSMFQTSLFSTAPIQADTWLIRYSDREKVALCPDRVEVHEHKGRS